MGFFVLLLAICLLIWGSVLAWRGSPVLGCAIYLIVACAFGGYFWTIDAAGLTWSLDRFFLAFLLIAFVVQWKAGKVELKPLTRAEMLLAAFFALLLFSTFTHDWRKVGPDDDSVLMHLVNGYLVPVTIFLLARNARLNEKNLRYIYIALGCFGVYLAGTAVAEAAHAWGVVFPQYISDPSLGTHYGRARGPMLQSARLGMYLIACGGALAALWTYSGKWTRHGVVLAAALLPCFLAAAYCTYTRSVWLGAGIALMIALTATLNRRWRTLTIVGALGMAAMVVAVKQDKLVAFQRDTTTAADTEKSTYMRASFAYVSWLMFQDRPITGVGFGHFPEESTHYLHDRNTTLHLEQLRGYIHHNTYLSLLVELGIFGLLLNLAVFGCWLWQAWTLWRDQQLPFWVRSHALLFVAVIACHAVQMLFREVSYAPIENGLIFFIAGTTSSLYATYKLADRKTAAALPQPAVQLQRAP